MCECYVRNVHNELKTLIGIAYVTDGNYLKIEYSNTTGFDFSLPVDDIYEYKNEENNILEIVCFTSTYSLSHVDSQYEELGNYLYKFRIHLKEVKSLYKDISDAKKKRLEIKKKNIEIRNHNLEMLKNSRKKIETDEAEKYIKINGSYGRTIPKKIAYTGFAYENSNENGLVIQFDDASEKKYLGQLFGNSFGNENIVINYNDIIDYYIKEKKLYIKVFNNGDFNEIKRDYSKENLLYFGNLIENDIFEIILEGEDLLKLKKILSKRVVLEENEIMVEEKKENKEKKIIEEQKKYKQKSTKGLGIFIIFYVLFYPLFWIISLPFMLISNFTGSYKKYSPNKTWNDWWNTKS